MAVAFVDLLINPNVMTMDWVHSRIFLAQKRELLLVNHIHHSANKGYNLVQDCATILVENRALMLLVLSVGVNLLLDG